jgi:hypothetical protein
VSARLEGGALVVEMGSLRRALLVAGALGFVVVGALMLAFGSLFMQFFGALAVVTFGTFLVVGLVQIARGPSQLVLTPEGLRWDAGARGREVPWDEVVRVDRWQSNGQAVLAIHVARPETVHRSLGSRLLARANHKLGAGDVNVPLNHLAVDRDLLHSIVEVCAREPAARGTIATDATLRRLQA